MGPNSATGQVTLRNVVEDDLPYFFEHQRDPSAVEMAAFPARDEKAFTTHWTKILGDPTVIKKTILFGDEIAGNIVSFVRSGKRLVGYWIGKDFWGKSIATRALSTFISQVDERPIHAMVAKHNLGSIRVLEKCGFVVAGEGWSPAFEGEEPVAEFIYALTE